MTQRPDLAFAMYPGLSRETKAREAAQQRQAAANEQRRQTLLEDLRELNRRADARMRADGKR